MPGDLIKLFDTQADWQSGALENLDATSTPGVIIPTGDYTKTYDSKAEWDQGTKANVVSDAEGRIMLDRPLRGNTSLGSTGQYEYDKVFMGQRISPRGLLAEVRMYVGDSSGYGRYMYVTNLSGYILWSQSMSSDGVWIGHPNLLVDEDVIVWVRALDWLYNVARAATDDYPPGVTENGRIGSSLATQPNYYRPLWVQYRCEYAESGTWLSPWLAHGISSPQSGMVSLRADIPAGTSAIPHVRYSSDGGSTYTDWHDLDDRRMTDLQGTHVQLRLTLATDDPRQTPVVDRAAMLIGKLHRWTSPAIDLTGVGADADLMLATSQTELDVVREVREYPNFTFTRSSTAYNPETGEQVGVNEPRYVEGPFDGSKALFVEEGTENLWTANGGINLSSISAYAAIVQPTYNVLTEKFAKTNVLRVDVGEGGSRYFAQSGLTPGLTYTSTLYVRPSADRTLWLLTDEGGSSKVWCPAGFFTRLQFSFTPTSSGRWIVVAGWQSNDIIDFSAPSLEQKPYPTSFTDGTRSPEVTTIPTAGVLNPSEGTIEMRINKRPPYDPTTITCFLSGTGTARWDVWDSPSTVFRVYNEAHGGWLHYGSGAFPLEEWNLISITWGAFGTRLYFNGVLGGSSETAIIDDFGATLHIGGFRSANYEANSYLADLRISSRARTDEEILTAYQSGKPLPVDEWTTYKMAGGPWESVGAVFPRPAWPALQARLTLTKTDTAAQSLDSVALWESVLMWMYDRPNLRVSPPQVTHVTVYVENSEPVVEYTASIAVEESKKIHIRVPVPEGSSLAYCQQVAEKILALKSEERLSITCKIPLLTRMRFGESVAVVMPYAGYTRENPYFGVIQKMTHYPLASSPYTEIQIGEYLPEDIEVLLRLYSSQKGGV